MPFLLNVFLETCLVGFHLELPMDVSNNHVFVIQQFLATLLDTLSPLALMNGLAFLGRLSDRQAESNGTGHGKDIQARITKQTMWNAIAVYFLFV